MGLALILPLLLCFLSFSSLISYPGGLVSREKGYNESNQHGLGGFPQMLPYAPVHLKSPCGS
jgi:hypothetical protein